jgi:D-tyrosyl-tRNA(Tyr) deacylase
MSGAPCGVSITVIALIQRVSSAIVRIEHQSVAEIDTGLLVFIGVKPTDTDENARRLLSRLLNYRVFPDDNSKMNVSLRQIGGGLLLVPQFTLTADTRHGLRPGFSTAAPPELGRRLFALLVETAQAQHSPVTSGQFGANMQVSLVNDGPVTFWLEG